MRKISETTRISIEVLMKNTPMRELNLSSLAKQNNVSRSTIYNIKRGLEREGELFDQQEEDEPEKSKEKPSEIEDLENISFELKELLRFTLTHVQENVQVIDFILGKMGRKGVDREPWLGQWNVAWRLIGNIEEILKKEGQNGEKEPEKKRVKEDHRTHCVEKCVNRDPKSDLSKDQQIVEKMKEWREEVRQKKTKKKGKDIINWDRVRGRE